MFFSKVNSEFISFFHKLVKYPESYLLDNTIGGRLLKQQLVPEDRKELEDKMAKVFGGRMKGLSTELQEIFIDDLVTAFESRLTVMNHAQKSQRC